MRVCLCRILPEGVQEYFDPLGKNASIRPAQCRQVVQRGVVVDSSQVVEPGSRESIARASPACGVQKDFDPLVRDTGANSRDEVIIEISEDNAVVGSFLECELASSKKKNSCSITGRIKLTASMQSEGEDDLCTNHSGCAGKRANKTSPSAGEQERRLEGSEMNPKKRRR